jgi:hypothetical protein
MPRGVRLNPEHDDRTRAKIQTSQIVNRLMQHANGEINMTSSQVRAAEILLKKTLPDISAVHHSGEAAPVQMVSDEELARRLLFNMALANHEREQKGLPPLSEESLQ